MSVPYEPSAKSFDWALKHKDVFEALIKVGYSRPEALSIMASEPWYRYIFDDEE